MVWSGEMREGCWQVFAEMYRVLDVSCLRLSPVLSFPGDPSPSDSISEPSDLFRSSRRRLEPELSESGAELN